jgi:hypothetical protein
MNSQFFTQLASLTTSGNLVITINLDTLPDLTVIVNHKDYTPDKAVDTIPPKVFTGTAEELDDMIFDAIATPLQENPKGFINKAAYEKSVKEALKPTTKGKPVAESGRPLTAEEITQQAEETRRQKEAAAKQKKYDTAMEAVDKLAKDHKYGEATNKLPDIKEFPDKEETIKARRAELLELREQRMTETGGPNLFTAINAA